MEHIDGPWRQAIADFLGVKTAKTKPSKVNMDLVQPVIEVSPNGSMLTEEKALTSWKRGTLGHNLEDAFSDTLYLVSYGDRGAPSNECIRLNPGELFVPFSAWYQFTLSYGFRVTLPNRMFSVELQTMYAHEPLVAWYTVWSASHETRDDQDQWPTMPGGYTGQAAGSRNMLSVGHIPMPLILPPCHHMRLLVQTHGDPNVLPVPHNWQFDQTCDWQVWVQGMVVPMGGPVPRFW